MKYISTLREGERINEIFMQEQADSHDQKRKAL